MLLIFGIILYFGLAPFLLTFLLNPIIHKILKEPDRTRGIFFIHMLSYLICIVVFLIFGPSVIL